MKYFFILLIAFFSKSAFSEDSDSSGSSGSSGSSDSSPGWLSKLWAYFDKIFEAIENFVKWLSDLVVEIFKSLFILLGDIVYFAIEVLFKFAAKLISKVSDSFDLQSISNQLQGYWQMVPVDVKQIMQAIGVPSALSIILVGILIRFALQLIPFIRLGS